MRQSWIITTVAGTGIAGFAGDGGPAERARLNGPFDVGFDAAGNLYFSDTFNHRARLNEPYGIALDKAGNLYIADRHNHCVRRVDAAGHITTFAGDGTAGFGGDGGPAAAARMVEPNGLALDPACTRLFIADVGDHRVRVVDLATGTIATFAGTGAAVHSGDGGPAVAAGIHGARAVKVAADGAVYILERQGSTLRRVDPHTGTITTIAGTGMRGYAGDGGPALAAVFDAPKEFALDRDGNPLVVDTENHAIRRIDLARGIVVTIAGGRRGPEALSGRRRGEEVADRGNQRPRIVSLHGVAGRGDRDVAALRQAARQGDGVLFEEHVAVAAAHDQGRAEDPGEPLGKPAAFGKMRLPVEALKAPPVVFPAPAAVRHPAQIVHQAPAQDLRVAPRIEGKRPRDDGLERGRFGDVVDKRADAPRSRTPHLRPGIDDDQRGKPFGIMDRKGKRVDGPHRLSDQDRAVEAELVGKAQDILALRRDRIVGLRIPIAVAVAALIERQAVIVRAQCQATQIPGMRIERPAMQKQHRRQSRPAPIEIVQVERADPPVAGVRQHHLGKVETGARRGRPQVLAILLGGQAHGRAAPSRIAAAL